MTWSKNVLSIYLEIALLPPDISTAEKLSSRLRELGGEEPAQLMSLLTIGAIQKSTVLDSVKKLLK